MNQIKPTPQRITKPAAPGALLKRKPESWATRPREVARMLLERQHTPMIRQLPCLKCGLDPCGEAHHFRLGNQMMGRRQKPERLVPLCRSCHQLDPDALHKVGEDSFWAALDVDPGKVARELYAVSGDLPAMRAVVFVAIAGRRR